MLNNIKHIFFDLDHTLWDFDKNSSETLAFLFDKHSLQKKHNVILSDFISQYHKANRELWGLFNHDMIDKYELRELRIQQTYSSLGIDHKHIPATFNDEYLSICPQKGNLFPNTIDILSHYFSSYDLHILSNGFTEIQDIKIETSGIKKYFKTVFTADLVGAKKPDIKFYNYVLSQINSTPDECIMIGDTIEADIIGANNADIKAIYFNPTCEKHNYQIEYEINSLLELKAII